MPKDVNIIHELVYLLQESQTTVLKLYQFVNGSSVNPTKAQFEKFRKELIASVKRSKENALQLFPIVKYFQAKEIEQDDLNHNETLFTVPTDEYIAVASPIEVLDEVPRSNEYDLTIMWDLAKLDERESELFKAVENYYNIIKDDENLRKFIRSIGTNVQESIELWEVDKDLFIENVPQETFALYQSNDLNNLLPSEIAQLDDPDLEIIFLKNFIEQKLLTYQLWGIEREIQEEWVIRQKDIGERGPLFLCLDTSGSMRNLKEIISKALMLVFVDELEKLGINLVFIPFATEAKYYDLYDSKFKFKSVKNNLRKSYYGGTDLEKLIDVIDSIIHKRKYEKANVLILSDFVFKKMSKNLLAKIDKIKEKGHKFHSLALNDQNYKNSLLTKFNSNWTYTYNWRTSEESFEEEMINQLMNASSTTIEFLQGVNTFGIIKKIKDYDFNVNTPENLVSEMNKKLELTHNKPVELPEEEIDINS